MLMRIYILALVAASATYRFNLFGLDGWYVQIWWYDIFMHILGGVATGFFVCICLNILFPNKKINYLQVIFLTLVFGLIWEGIELYYDITGHPLGTVEYNIDTIADLINDMIGGTIARFIYGKLKKSTRSSLVRNLTQGKIK